MARRRGPNPPGPVGGVGAGNPPAPSVGLAAGQIPPVLSVVLAAGQIPPDLLVVLAAGQIPPDPSVVLVGAMASGCCDSRSTAATGVPWRGGKVKFIAGWCGQSPASSRSAF